MTGRIELGAEMAGKGITWNRVKNYDNGTNESGESTL
jgi:hypothetical protein